MPICSDRAAKALSNEGYNLVRYPRPNIMPLDILAGAQSPLQWLGPIRVVWKTTAAAPVPEVGNTPKFTYERSGEFKGSLGMKILQGLLGGALKDVAANASIAASSTLSFAYESPTQLSVALFDIGEYLQTGDLNSENMAIKRYLAIDNALETHFYLITEVLRARKLLVRISGGSAQSLQADATALQGLVAGHAEIANKRENSTEVAFDGGEDVTFAFRAYELGYVDGQWVLIGAADKTAFLSGGSAGAQFGVLPVQIQPAS
jgi:hypothetical protein